MWWETDQLFMSKSSTYDINLIWKGTFIMKNTLIMEVFSGNMMVASLKRKTNGMWWRRCCFLEETIVDTSPLFNVSRCKHKGNLFTRLVSSRLRPYWLNEYLKHKRTNNKRYLGHGYPKKYWPESFNKTPFTRWISDRSRNQIILLIS